MTKLNQVLAIEKGVKAKTKSEVTKLYKAVQKPALFEGFAKSFSPKNEDGEVFPPEKKRVQVQAREAAKIAARQWSELFDVTARKDFANTEAKADVVVDGQTLVEGAPVTYLLFLEKQLKDVRTFVDNIPTLSPDESWTKDVNSGLFKTGEELTVRTKKVQRPIVLYDATDKHPAQTQLISEDVVIGTWSTVKQSGALPEPEKKQLQENVDKVLKAVVFAREQANSIEAPEKRIGDAIFSFIGLS